MKVFETNCILLVTGYQVLFEVFHQMYWNDTENIFCIPTAKITDQEWKQLFEKGVPEGAKKAEYIIAEI